MNPKMSLMVGTKMTKALVKPNRTTVMMVWRIQLKSLEAHSRWLTEVRIYADRDGAEVSLHPPEERQDRRDLFATYREQHHGDGEGDGGQHGQPDDQQEHVGLVNLGVGVQQLGLHVHCVEGQQRVL